MVRRIALILVSLFTLLLPWLGAAPARAAETEFLEPEQAFVLRAEAQDATHVAVRFQIAPGYYLYREHFKFAANGATLGEPVYPKGKVKFDQTFQKEVETYRDAVTVQVPVTAVATPGAAFELMVTSQGCADAGLCYPPQTAPLRVSLNGFGGTGEVVPADATNAGHATPAAPGGVAARLGLGSPATAAQTAPSTGSEGTGATAALPGGRVEALLRGGSLPALLGGFWLMGLLLAFTPCVLPMVPILSSIIAGGGPVSRGRGFALALAYALGMALVYTGLGVAAGLAGEGLAAALQKPAVLLGFGALLVIFALSMFDVYELRLPLALSNRLDGASRQLPGGRFVGVFLMGGLSALIVSPCVTGPLASVLIFLSQTRDVVLSGAALFVLALGMSTPLLLLGASAGQWLPRSGAWMHAVKRFFGLLLIAVALWIVQPVLPPALVFLAWGALLLVTGFMLRPFDPHPHSHAPRVWLQRAAGLAALAFGVMQLAGAASGARDPLQPLAQIGAGAGSATATAAHATGFQRVRSVAELDAALASAGRPVMLDFYADWCVSCKEMERFTFSDPAVQAKLKNALLLQADVTANSDEDKALLKRFQLFGPPGIIFFDAQGREQTAARVIGFQKASDFVQSLAQAGL